jgi:hypothetical protein
MIRQRAGKGNSQGAKSRLAPADVSMFPQVGVSGPTPAPKKSTVASKNKTWIHVRMKSPIAIEPVSRQLLAHAT